MDKREIFDTSDIINEQYSRLYSGTKYRQAKGYSIGFIEILFILTDLFIFYVAVAGSIYGYSYIIIIYFAMLAVISFLYGLFSKNDLSAAATASAAIVMPMVLFIAGTNIMLILTALIPYFIVLAAGSAGRSMKD